jgi:hypothetical protein
MSLGSARSILGAYAGNAWTIEIHEYYEASLYPLLPFSRFTPFIRRGTASVSRGARAATSGPWCPSSSPKPQRWSQAIQ